MTLARMHSKLELAESLKVFVKLIEMNFKANTLFEFSAEPFIWIFPGVGEGCLIELKGLP